MADTMNSNVYFPFIMYFIDYLNTPNQFECSTISNLAVSDEGILTIYFILIHLWELKALA